MDSSVWESKNTLISGILVNPTPSLKNKSAMYGWLGGLENKLSNHFPRDVCDKSLRVTETSSRCHSIQQQAASRTCRVNSHLHLCDDGVGLTDLLTQLYQFHLCRHVSHRPHALSQVLVADKAIFVFVKLSESFPKLCRD